MGADRAADPGSIPHFDLALLNVAEAKEATAFRALALRLYCAALLPAALTCVAFANGLSVGEILNQVLFFPAAILSVTDLLPIIQAVSVFVAEAPPTILAHADPRPAAGPQPARHLTFRNHQTSKDTFC